MYSPKKNNRFKKKEQVSNFLKSHKMHWSDFSWENNINHFRLEMEKGLKGESGSLAMLLTFIDPYASFLKDKPVIVIDAGGTNIRIASITIAKNGKANIKHFQKHTMPGAKKEVSKKEFFQTIANWIKPVINTSDRIGFCFSYPTEMQDNLDGKLLSFSKEIKAPEVIGCQIGEELLKSLKDNGLDNNKKIVLLNDTVSTLLAGKSKGESRGYEEYLGFILGTGCNMAYTEDSSAIKKNSHQQLKQQIINIESGNYEGLTQGAADLILDKKMGNPGHQLFEKKVGGAYFGSLCHETIKLAKDFSLAKGSIFSSSANKYFNSSLEINSQHISDFLKNPHQEQTPFSTLDVMDKEILYYLLDEMVTRSAFAVCIQMAAVLERSEKGRNPLHPICINVDGSTIHKTHAYKNKLNFFLQEYCQKKSGVFYELTKVDDAPLVGSAIAALME